MAMDPFELPTQEEIERGLRFSHIMMMVNQSQSNETLTAIMAITDLLVAKGVISGEEFTEARAAAAEQMENISQPRVRLGNMGDKYEDARTADIDCAARLHLCQARCCSFNFFLTHQDLEEGVAKWDYGNPYWIKHGEDGYCTHCDGATRGCTIHAQRPHVCRLYDCRNDKRVWIDFEKRIPVPFEGPPGNIPIALAEPDLGPQLMNTASSDEDS